MLPLRRAVSAGFCSALLMGLAWGCSASNDAASSTGTGNGGNPGIGEAGNDVQTLSPDSGEAGNGSLGLNPLCGSTPLCIPDQPGECAHYSPPPVDIDASSDGTPTPQGGESGEGGAAGQSTATGAAGAAGMAGASTGDAAGAGGAAGAAGAPGLPLPRFSCQVQRSAASLSAVVSACAVVGSGGVNAPCLTSSDCGWDAKHGALGCVGDANSGLCEPYCCKGDDTCAVGSYCAERQLRDALTNQSSLSPAAPKVMIPVCVPAENCDLSTPYPCPEGMDCACKADTACMVVRADGTTTCAAPGAGKAGDACPCAWGHVCSAATNKCLKLCYTRGTPSCGTGTCQASAELPDGWGVCIGAALPSGG